MRRLRRPSFALRTSAVAPFAALWRTRWRQGGGDRKTAHLRVPAHNRIVRETAAGVVIQKPMPLSRPRVKGRGAPCEGPGASSRRAGRDEAEYLRAHKRARSGGEKRFRKTDRKERAPTAGGEGGFVENSRQESKRRKSHRTKIPPPLPCQTQGILQTIDVVRRIIKSGEHGAAGRTGAGQALPRELEGQGAPQSTSARDKPSLLLRTGEPCSVFGKDCISYCLRHAPFPC